MGRRSRQKRERRRQASQQSVTELPQVEAWPTQAEAFAWTDHDGLHALSPGEAPSPELLEEMSRRYREQIRQSPLGEQMVAQFGAEEAERCSASFAWSFAEPIRQAA